jgi:hypothetical protein
VLKLKLVKIILKKFTANFKNWIVTPQNIPFSFEKGMEQIFILMLQLQKKAENNS